MFLVKDDGGLALFFKKYKLSKKSHSSPVFLCNILNKIFTNHNYSDFMEILSIYEASRGDWRDRLFLIEKKNYQYFHFLKVVVLQRCHVCGFDSHSVKMEYPLFAHARRTEYLITKSSYYTVKVNKINRLNKSQYHNTKNK